MAHAKTAPVDTSQVEIQGAAFPLWRRILREPVALGLVPLILLRPISDGATWPADNFYFVWGILLLAGIFLARMLMRGSAPRFKLGTILLGCFWLAGTMTLATTVQYGATYRTAIIWAGHFFLFLAVVNGVRSRTAVAIVMSALMASFLVEVLYTFVHFNFILPMMRQMVRADSYVVRTRLGAGADTTDFIHRMQMNRASGSLLFPNALAGFLIMAIPITFAEMLQSFRAYGARRPQQPTGEVSPLAVTLAASLTWMALVCLSYFTVTLISAMRLSANPDALIDWSQAANWAPFAIFVVIGPLAVAAAVAVALQRGGWRALGLWMRVGVLPPLLAGELWMLWLTYSRGGMLALLMASGLMAALLAGSNRGYLRRFGKIPATAGLLLAVVLATLVGADTPTAAPADQTAPTAAAPVAPAPAPPAQPDTAGLTTQGKDVGVAELASGATFKLRLTYWRTGLAMALDNFWTGVGWGNFGACYPNYRKPGAGAVTVAHNEYLQALCETGILGFAFFCAFWLYLVWWGVARILREQDRHKRWELIGLYTALLAVLAHSVIDFDFYDPSVAFFGFLTAGLLVSRGLGDASAPADGPSKRAAVCQSAAAPADGPSKRAAVCQSASAPADGPSKRAAACQFAAAPADGPSKRAAACQLAATPADGSTKRLAVYQLAALPLLVVAALVAGMAFRVFISDFIKGRRDFIGVGDDRKLKELYYEAQFFFPPPEETQNATKPRAIAATHLAGLVQSASAFDSAGAFLVPSGKEGKMRRVRADEPVPREAVYAVSDFEKAKKVMLPFAEAWIAQLKLADSVFPCDPELAAELLKWCDLLARSLPEGEDRRRFVLDSVAWAQEAVRRSPRESGYRMSLGNALWLRAGMETDKATWTRLMDDGLAEFKTAAELFPSSGSVLREYGNAMLSYGRALRRAAKRATGKTAPEAEQMVQQAKDLISRADGLDAAELRF